MRRTSDRREFAVIGLGRFGASLALELARLGHSVLAVDRDPALVQSMADELTQVVALDATDEDALRSVGIEAFDVVVVAVGNDFENSVLITSLLKEIGTPQVVCKALTQRQKAILLRVGADRVILPEHEAGQRLARQLAQPHVIDWLEMEPGVSVSEIHVPEAFVGRTLSELDLSQRFGLTVLAIKGRRLRLAPRADEVLHAGNILLVVGTDEAVAGLQSWKP